MSRRIRLCRRNRSLDPGGTFCISGRIEQPSATSNQIVAVVAASCMSALGESSVMGVTNRAFAHRLINPRRRSSRLSRIQNIEIGASGGESHTHLRTYATNLVLIETGTGVISPCAASNCGRTPEVGSFDKRRLCDLSRRFDVTPQKLPLVRPRPILG